MQNAKTLIVITGPTASGKTSLAVELALFLHTDIVNADSRQVFHGIPIVTALPTPEEMRGVRHRLLDFLTLDAYYSASAFEQDALREISDIFSTRDYAVVCGGSMMYVDALCNGIDPLPDIPDDIRNSLKAQHAANGDDWLRNRLRRLDPDYFATVDLHNLKRVFHAVETSIVAGRPYSSLLSGEKQERPFRIVKLAIGRERDDLFARINRRVDIMVANGLEEEARRVYPLRGLNALNTVGIKEMFAYFDGEMDFPTAVARIGKNTRVYAKKQLTWLKRDTSLIWLAPDAGVADIMQIVQKS